ncbi:MAG: PSD1 and planctomycete cytochrome C domain-containing protein [Gemmataceae bacterium]|nr:PSD1 and planctomycete cytochrome C domain-containing protein [Gemmataceae bacterium]
MLLLLLLSADFARDVRPLLESRCARCHGAKKAEGGLRLDQRSRILTSRNELLKRIGAADDTRMPPSGKPLDEGQRKMLRAWLDAGAPGLADERHWSFKPVVRPVPSGGSSPIDGFVKAGPAADRATLSRRLHLDLAGLPPALDEPFLADARPDSWERLVDRLLSSPAFGERWGRHWLDLARYAESDGYENDRLRPGAHLWRDWVVRSFNADQPFDRFTIEQLAGDLLPKPTPEQRMATGLHRNTLHNSAASGDKEEFRTRAVKDRAETTATAWLGLTLGCAQCHGHKYDPITHRDYYRLYAFFDRTGDDTVGKAPALKAVPRVSFVHKRGDFLSKGETVAPGTPESLPPLKPRGKEADRLDLARWLVDASNPLTARVEANRAWQHLFGEGIVATPENFGKQGAPPTNPRLLDWLASSLQEDWSRKRLIRRIAMSDAYRQASRKGVQGRFRLEAEIIRDTALAVAGLLDRRMGGESIVPPFPKEMPAGQFTAEAFKGPTKDRHRRGIYIHVQRTLTHPSLAALDAPDGNAPCPRRDRGTSPVQALALLNDPVFAEAARGLGARLMNADDGVALGFRLCLGRLPTAEERGIMERLVKKLRSTQKEPAAWAGVARVLLNLDEFVNRE